MEGYLRALCITVATLTVGAGAISCGSDDLPNRSGDPSSAIDRESVAGSRAGGPGVPIATSAPLNRFAPEVNLHRDERLLPARALAIGDPRDPNAHVVKRGKQTTVSRTPTYIELRRARGVGERTLRITYWQLYDADLRDWERISVLLQRDGPNRYVPLSVRYHLGQRSRDIAWTATERVAAPGERRATHPVVYAALDSHLPLWRAGRFRGLDQAGSVSVAMACDRCPRWTTWEWVRRHQEDTLAAGPTTAR